MLVLSRKILGAYPTSFFSCLVVGSRGIGKSTYSLWALHDVFISLGTTDNQAWRLALGSLKFSIPEVIDFIQKAIDDDEKRVCLIWDDTRVHGSGSQYRFNMRLVTTLGGMLDSIRTSVSSLIMTAPSNYGLLGILKSYDDYLIKIYHTSEGGFNRLGKGYKWSTLPSGTRRIYPKFKDPYSCYIPVWVYNKYMARRKAALANAVTSLKKEIDKEKH